jgi:hypothetical protein
MPRLEKLQIAKANSEIGVTLFAFHLTASTRPMTQALAPKALSAHEGCVLPTETHQNTKEKNENPKVETKTQQRNHRSAASLWTFQHLIANPKDLFCSTRNYNS